MSEGLILSLNFLSTRYDQLEEVKQTFQAQEYNIEQRLKETSQLLELSTNSKQYYIKAIDLLYQQSIVELEQTINIGLGYIFYDKKYELKLELEDSRGSKNMKLKLYDRQMNELINLKHGTGAGIRSVISFVFKVYYILAERVYPLLLLDEAYSEISEDYIERFFAFIKGLCNERGLRLVMITHDPRFISQGDHVYKVVDGRIFKEG